MDDLSLHILDIAENSVRADAKRIEILIAREPEIDQLRIEVNDDGRGMDSETLLKVQDPFFSTKNKKTGLGIPLLTQAAEQAGGTLTVDSAPGKGTRVSVTFKWSHVDRPALGSMADTVLTLIAGHPDIDVLYEIREGDRAFRLDTQEFRKELEDVPVNAPAVLSAIREMLKEQIQFEM